MTYDEVKTNFRQILNRTDITDALTVTFLNFAITRAQRELRTPPQENLASITTTTGFTYLPTPADFIKPIAVTVNGMNVAYIPPQTFFELTPVSSSQPAYWTRVGANIYFNPNPLDGSSISFFYYGQFAPFTTGAQSTVLSTIAPDLIIYGALSYASDYYLDERGSAFEQRFQEIKQHLQDQSYDADGPGVMQPAYAFPSDE